MALNPNKLMLLGQRVLVTGSGRGIGRAIAVICHEQGARVALTSRTRAELEETRAVMLSKTTRGAACPPNGSDGTDKNILLHVADVTQPDQVEQMVQGIVQEWGGIDILINNAGASQAVKGAADKMDIADLERLLSINVVAVQSVSSAVVRHAMRKQAAALQDNNSKQQSTAGIILNISSKAGKIGIPNNSFYVASKFALEGLTASWAAEYQPLGIRVNSISPGMVHTASFPKPAGRPGVRTAESIEESLLFLLGQCLMTEQDDKGDETDNNSKQPLTGHYLHVDEYDQVKSRSLPPQRALKPINEPSFENFLSLGDEQK